MWIWFFFIFLFIWSWQPLQVHTNSDFVSGVCVLLSSVCVCVWFMCLRTCVCICALEDLCLYQYACALVCVSVCLCVCVCALVCVTLRNGKVDHHSAAPLPVSTVHTCICAPHVAAHLHMHIPTHTCVYAMRTIAMCTVCTMWFPMLCVIKWSQEGSFCWFTGFMHRQREHRKGPLGTGRDKRGKHMFYRRMNSPGSTYIWLTATALMNEIHNIGLCQPD